MSDDRQWPGPRELAEYLKRPDIKKARHQFRRRDGRCCLGHYADMCGLEYPDEQAGFKSRSDSPRGLAALPEGHWLLRPSPEYEWLPLPKSVFPNTDDCHGPSVQSVLAAINDTSAGFNEAIEFLEQLVDWQEAVR